MFISLIYTKKTVLVRRALRHILLTQMSSEKQDPTEKTEKDGKNDDPLRLIERGADGLWHRRAQTALVLYVTPSPGI